MTQPAPPLTGQDIGEAHGAVGALLDHKLRDTGFTARQFVILRVIKARGPWARAELEAFLVSQPQLAVDLATAAAELDGLGNKGLVEDCALTKAGEQAYERLSTLTAATSAQLYAGIAPDELATTRSVLRRVIDRAQELRAV